ncbi:hypothetical protein TSOC_015375, partial [Tetrabaena socialis]
EKKVFVDLHSRLTDYKTLAFFHFMCDALNMTDAVFKLMQVQQFKFSDVANTVRAVQSCLSDAFVTVAPGQYTTPILSSFFSEMRATNFASFQGHVLKDVPSSGTRLTIVHELFQEYAKNLIANLGARFPNNAFLSALAVFDPAEYPESWEEVRPWATKHMDAVNAYFVERRAAAGEAGDHPTLDVGEARDQFFNGGAMKMMWELRGTAISDREKFVKFYVEQKAMLSRLLEDGMPLVDEGLEGLEAMQSLNGPSAERPPHHINVVMRTMTGWGRGMVPMFLKLMLFCVLIKPTSVN